MKLGDMVWDRRQSKSVLPYQYAGFILTPGDPRQGIYYIQGKVRRPGVYSIAGRTITLRQAIAAAGGITAPSSGDKLKCAITHHHSNGKEETIRFDDIQALLSSPGPNLDIQPEDVIDFQ